jgi:L-2-hydroxycarboxylate dehydrogenase (NAD+)
MHSTIVNTGSMAFYLRLMAEQNIIGLMSCNSQRLVAPPKGREKMLGTNPMGIGIPSKDGKHFIADFATSAIAYGKVLVAQDKGEDLPEGCIIDKDGNPSINPKDAAGDGAILPLADYRGFALGLFIELMATMAGGTAAKDDWYGKDGMFIIAIDPNHIAGEGFANKVESLLGTIRNSEPASGQENVSIPGDRSAEKLNQSLDSGVTNVTDKTLENLKGLAE